MTRALLLSLLLAGCSAAAPTPPSAPPTDEAARRGFWREEAAGIFGCRSYRAVDDYLDGIRVLPPHLPRHVAGGGYALQGGAMVYDDLYTLDENFDLYVIWNGEGPSGGVRSVEVVGFVDLRPRFRPDHFEALRALHRSVSVGTSWDFDQVLLIRAANAVRSLGAEAAPALRAYAALAAELPVEELRKRRLDARRLFPVIQLHCTNPSPFRLGDGGVAYPGPATWPLFPLTLEGDLPFLVVSGYTLFGVGEDPVRRLDEGFALRADPLAPTLDPVAAVESLTSSPRWAALLSARDPWREPPSDREGKALKQWVRRQALQALSSVYRAPDEDVAKGCCEDPSEQAWRRVVDEVRALGIRWDPVRQDFVRSR